MRPLDGADPRCVFGSGVDLGRICGSIRLARATHEGAYPVGAYGERRDRPWHPECVLDRAGYGRSAADGPSLAGALDPEGIVGGWCVLADEGLYSGNLGGGRFQVVDKRRC